MTQAPHVFLAGTCGGDSWRTPFEATLDRLGLSYFNPQVDHWQPWMSDRENLCMHHSPMVLFPVLRSTLGLGSLAEIGFSILSVLRSIQDGRHRDLIVHIDEVVDPDVTLKHTHSDGRTADVPAGPAVIAESLRARSLVLSKVKQETWRPGVHLVGSLDEMHALMVTLVAPRPADARSA
jgi:hypothetical protein